MFADVDVFFDVIEQFFPSRQRSIDPGQGVDLSVTPVQPQLLTINFCSLDARVRHDGNANGQITDLLIGNLSGTVVRRPQPSWCKNTQEKQK